MPEEDLLIPLELPYGSVNHRAVSVTADGSDEDLYPDISAIANLMVTFTPSVKLAVVTGDLGPVTITPQTVYGKYDANGVLRPYNGSEIDPAGTVRLLSTSGTDILPTGWTWKASWSLRSFPSVTFQVEKDQQIDLSSLLLTVSVPNASTVYADLIAAANAVRAALAEADAADFKGAKGDKGDKGDAGVSNVVFVNGTSAADIPVGTPANTLVVLRAS